MTLNFRPALASDIAECIQLRGLTRENAVSAERLAELGVTQASWAAQVSDGSLPGWIAEQEHILGYCFADVQSGEIVVLALLPQAEGKGIGQQLIQRAMHALRQHGHQRLFLACSRNPAVRSYGFYRHLGWRSTGQLSGQYDEVLEYLFSDEAGTSQVPVN